jgi:hypothetical protein
MLVQLHHASCPSFQNDAASVNIPLATTFFLLVVIYTKYNSFQLLYIAIKEFYLHSALG